MPMDTNIIQEVWRNKTYDDVRKYCRNDYAEEEYLRTRIFRDRRPIWRGLADILSGLHFEDRKRVSAKKVGFAVRPLLPFQPRDWSWLAGVTGYPFLPLTQLRELHALHAGRACRYLQLCGKIPFDSIRSTARAGHPVSGSTFTRSKANQRRLS